MLGPSDCSGWEVGKGKGFLPDVCLGSGVGRRETSPGYSSVHPATACAGLRTIGYPIVFLFYALQIELTSFFTFFIRKKTCFYSLAHHTPGVIETVT